MVETFKDKHKTLQVRQEAARALTAIGSSAVPALIETLKDKGRDWLVRLETVKMLGEIGDAQAIPTLVEALDDKDASVCRVTALALMEIALHHPHPALRTASPALTRL